MFSFANIKKLFKYSWGDVLKNILPKGKNGNLTEEEQKTLKISSILGIIASALVIISVVVLVYEVYMSILGPLAKYTKEGFFDIVSIGEIIWTIIKCAIIPIGILVYDIVMGKKEQNGWVIFAMTILVLLWVVYAFYEGVYGLRAIGYAPISVLIGLAGAFATLLAGGNMFTVFIDYSQRYNNGGAPVSNNAPVQNNGYTPVQEQPVQNNGYTPVQEQPVQNTYAQPQQPVQDTYAQPEQPVQEQQAPAQKVCPQCGFLVKGDAEFCSMCGHRF